MKRGKRDNLFQRGGSWNVDIIIDGQRIRRSFGKDKRAAEAVLHDLEKKRTLGLLGCIDGIESMKPRTKKQGITFAEMCEKFIELRQDCKQITLSAYARVINRNLLPAFGKMRLDQVTHEGISRFRAKLLAQGSSRRTRTEEDGRVKNEFKALKPSTVNTMLGVLKNILDEAVRTGDLENNPFRRVRGSRVERRENKPLSLEQVHNIIEHCDEVFKPMLTFLAYTGCRPCEAYALKWKQIDFDKGEILIDSGRVYGIEGTPKTKAGRRIIPMLPPVRAALRLLKEQRLVVEMGRHVFLTRKGQPINENTALYRAWTSALKNAGLPRRRPYELRHSFASNMLAAGMPIPFISRMIGHANPATTFAYYAGDVEALRPQYASKMADLLAEASKSAG